MRTRAVGRHAAAGLEADKCDEDEGGGGGAREQRKGLHAEGDRCRHCDEPWAERWRWLHRIKGIIATLRACCSGAGAEEGLSATEAAPADTVLAAIESLRPLTSTPDDMEERWASCTAALAILM